MAKTTSKGSVKKTSLPHGATRKTGKIVLEKASASAIRESLGVTPSEARAGAFAIRSVRAAALAKGATAKTMKQREPTPSRQYLRGTMRTVGAVEAKAHLSRLIDEVTRGRQVEITKNGMPVALLVPIPSTQRLDVQEVIRQMRELRHGITLGNLSLREMIEEGRRG
ncbi:MAG TPA: type II toxin-antitoxin system prevent-host-death family antitoxin [Thermoanaerobaculia bacterium]|nr:type II toxin-antitoxin system prevent-host-death family antitoxin [Thermoanaerobaculia bacterium]